MKRNEVLYKEPDHGQTFVSPSLKTGEKGEDGAEKVDISGSTLILKSLRRRVPRAEGE